MLGSGLEHWVLYQWERRRSSLVPFLDGEEIRQVMRLMSGLIVGQQTQTG